MGHKVHSTPAEDIVAGDRSSNQCLNVNVCKASGQTADDRNDAASAIEEGLSELYVKNTIDGYVIRQWDVEHSANSNSNVLEEWANWLNNNHKPTDGTWLLVHGIAGGGSGSGWNAAVLGPSAFDQAVPATVSTTRVTNRSMFKSLALHEVLHTTIDNSDGDIKEMTEGEGNHHYLGKDFYKNGKDYRTPMSVGHGTASEKGTCSEYRALGVSYTRSPSSCTIDAVNASANNI